MKVIIMLSTLLWLGCGDSKSESHFFGQIESQFKSCDLASPERITEIEKKYGKDLIIQNNSHEEVVYNYLANIPDEYLEWTFNSVGLDIELRGEGSQVTGLRGLTTIRGLKPISMWVKPPRDLGTGYYYGLIHEIGHGIDHYLFAKHGQYTGPYNKEWEKTYQLERSRLWFLPAANEQELIASVFDSYYCGQETRDILAKKYPRLNQLATRYFAPPVKP